MKSWTAVHITEAEIIRDAQVTNTDTYYSVTIPIQPDAPTMLVLDGRATVERLRDVLNDALECARPAAFVTRPRSY